MQDDNTKNPHGQSDVILKDINSKGEERPWRDKKVRNVFYFEALTMLGASKAERVASCGEVLEFDVLSDGSKKLRSAWFCKSPLCPMCNWRKAMKHSIQMIRVVSEAVRRKPTGRWLFLTLTVKNAWTGEDLDKSLKEIHRALNRLFKYQKVRKNLFGFVRSTEVTVNQENGSYNQHIHILIFVKSTYFKDSSNYIEQAEWAKLWKRACKLSYTPVVDIQVVKNKGKRVKQGGVPVNAILETGKYSVKDADYLTGDLDEDTSVVADLEEGLYRKRMIGWGGLLKEIHAELNLSDLEENLVQLDDIEKTSEEVAFSIVAVWHWKLQNYFIQERE